MTESMDLSGKDKDELIKIFIGALGNQKAETWMWRGLVVVLLLLNFCLVIGGYFWQAKRFGEDNKARAEHWSQIETGLDRNRAMIARHYEAIIRVDEHLRQCTGCHAHPTIK